MKEKEKIHKSTEQFLKKIGRPIFALLPTPLVRFCPNLLDPPSPPKIGHHLCTFPYKKQESIVSSLE